MNEVMQIIRINAYIQHSTGKLYLLGKEVLCVALDGTCTFVEGGTDVELTDVQREDLLNQTFGQAPATMASYTILASRWFTNPTVASMTHEEDASIGIVAIRTNTHEPEAPDIWKAYIGMSHGVNRQVDEQNVASWGTGLLPEEAHGFFPQLDIMRYKDS
jgi:hypothetical protein